MPELPPGTRRNALDADSYVALRPVDVRVVEALLLSLEDAGVAAYESAGVVHVDPALRSRASAVVAAELPGLLAELAPVDPDEAFSAIVAAWDQPHDDPVPRWPVVEDADHVTPPTARERDDRPLVSAGPEAYLVDEDAEHFEPPPPPPVPRMHPRTVASIVAIAAGITLLFLLPLFGVRVSQGWQRLAVLGIGGGVATLVWRMRDAPLVDDDPDEGAVI
jgi:hypothetical protein